MKAGVIGVALTDAILLIFAYFVQQDLEWRSGYASSHGYSVSTSYSLLTRVFTMSRSGTSLSSPLTLDWIQVVIALLIIVNVTYFVGWMLGSRGASSKSNAGPAG